MIWFTETLYPAWRQTFAVSRVLMHVDTDVQDLAIFETAGFGRVLALDGIVQTTTADEFIYHEMLTHVPLIAHGRARSICVVGGGDGGVLREAFKHPLERAVLVEIDAGVIDMAKAWLPSLSDGAFDDPRLEVVIADGIAYMAEDGETFDVIVIDSTDPQGPGEVLFTEAFYADCKKRLSEGGILVTQNGVPFVQPDELTDGFRRLSKSFADVGFFVAAVPTYAGGFMALGWATDDPTLRRLPAEEIAARSKHLAGKTRYWTPDLQTACFALPGYIRDLIAA